MGAETPRWDLDSGRYVWESAQPAALEPAFVREAIQSLDPEADNVEVRSPIGVTTFGDVYPRGTRGHAETDAPSPDELEDPADEWRMPSEVADDLLVSLPEGTPRMVRTLLTLLLGGLRRG